MARRPVTFICCCLMSTYGHIASHQHIYSEADPLSKLAMTRSPHEQECPLHGRYAKPVILVAIVVFVIGSLLTIPMRLLATTVWTPPDLQYCIHGRFCHVPQYR